MIQHILLFGLSANPPTYTTGHMGIATYFANLYDQVWLIPVYRHPYTSKRQLLPYEQRIQMLQLSLSDLNITNKDKIIVSTIEKEAFHYYYPHHEYNDPTVTFGTYMLIQYIYSKYNSEYIFHLYTGTDTFLDIVDGKWLNSKELLRDIVIDICIRKGYTKEFPSLSPQFPYYFIHSKKDLESILDENHAFLSSDPTISHYILIHHPQLDQISSSYPLFLFHLL